MSGSPCCPPGSWGTPQEADGFYQHKGHFEELAGVNCYVTGASQAKVVILSFSDVLPCLMDRKREVADQLAEAIPSSQVIAPDYFRGKPILEAFPPKYGKFRLIFCMLTSMPRILYRVRCLHTWSSLGPMLEGLTGELRRRQPGAHFLCYGYCFGGYVVCKVCSYLGFSAGLSYHPSPQICTMQPAQHRQTLQELASAVRCPVLLLPAGNDGAGLKEDGEFTRWLPEGSSHTYETMKHGFMSRACAEEGGIGRLMDLGTSEDVAACQADALRRTIDFFKAAVEKPPVPAVPAPSSKPAAGGGRWFLPVLAVGVVGVGVALAARKGLRK